MAYIDLNMVRAGVVADPLEWSGGVRRTRFCWRPSERAGPVKTYEAPTDGRDAAARAKLEAEFSGRFSGAKTAF